MLERELPLDEVGEENTADADSQTTGLVINLAIGIPVTLLCLVLFDPIRRRFPSIFETRRKLHEDREPLDYMGNRITSPRAPSYKFFGWFRPTLRLDLETIADTHGLDAALFLRYHRAMFVLFCLLLIPSVILLPTFYTGTNKDLPLSNSKVTIGVNRLSISNIPTNDKIRFWVVLVAEYFIFGFVCYYLYYHFTLYCRDRRRYRAARHPVNYAVLVQDIPHGARTAEAVKDYWDLVFPGQIAKVFYVQDARRLQKWKDRFWTAVNKREWNEWRAYDTQQKQSRKDERKEARRERRNARRMSNRHPLQDNVKEPDIEHGENCVRSDLDTTTDSQLAEPHQSRLADDATADGDAAVDQHNQSKAAPRNMNYSGRRVCGLLLPIECGPPCNPDAAAKYWEVVQRKAWAKVEVYQQRRHDNYFDVTNSAIVVFKSRRAASVAAQTNFSRNEHEWRVSRAPDPNAINWGALCVNGYTIYLRQGLTAIFSSIFTIFWVIPVTAIMALVSISELAKLEIGGSQPFSFLGKVEELSPYLVGLIESYAPAIVLSLFLSWVPSIFRLFVSISRITSETERDRLVRDWYFTFVVFSNFLFVAFAGSLLKSFARILDEPKDAVIILANNIPKQAAFMMNFILLTTLTEVPRELLQLGRVISRKIALSFSARTERQRQEADVGEMDMDYVEFYSISQLMTLLGLVYCTIQPLIVLCCMAYFALSYLVFKYNLCYSFYNEYEDGGRMYGGALYGVWVGLFVHLLTMVGVLGLNKSAAQSVLIILPTVFSVLYILHCRKSFSRVLEHGSALETQDRVEKMEACSEDVIEDELAETYEHPGWEELPRYNELENLNGLSNGDLAKAAEKEAMLDEVITIDDETATVVDENSIGDLSKHRFQARTDTIEGNSDSAGDELGDRHYDDMDNDFLSASSAPTTDEHFRRPSQSNVDDESDPRD